MSHDSHARLRIIEQIRYFMNETHPDIVLRPNVINHINQLLEEEYIDYDSDLLNLLESYFESQNGVLEVHE